jgi:hypothetical protein
MLLKGRTSDMETNNPEHEATVRDAERNRIEIEQKFPRDRDGEIFQDDLGEDHDASPQAREDAAHEVILDPDTDSQDADEFMRERFGNRRELS